MRHGRDRSYPGVSHGKAASIGGSWRVVREGGLLPPIGVSKLIWSGRGYTALFGVPVAWFRLDGPCLRYVALPVADELSELPDGSWAGRGLVFGREFCRFRMVRDGGLSQFCPEAGCGRLLSTLPGQERR